MKPKEDIFNKLGQALVQQGATVDLFLTSSINMELATISPLSVQTSGNVHFYQDFTLS